MLIYFYYKIDSEQVRFIHIINYQVLHLKNP